MVNKSRLNIFLILVVLFFSISLVSATTDFGYNNLKKPTLSKTVVNYTNINVNSSEYWGDHPASDHWSDEDFITTGNVQAVGTTWDNPAFQLGTNTGIYGTNNLAYVSVGSSTKTYSFQQTKFTGSGSSGFSISRNSKTDPSAPSYAWNTDSDTGMYNPSADTIGFSTGGTQKMKVDTNVTINNGSALGIGGTPTEYPLHIQLEEDVSNFGEGIHITKGIGSFSLTNGVSTASRFLPSFVGVGDGLRIGLSFDGTEGGNVNAQDGAILYRVRRQGGSGGIDGDHVAYSFQNYVTQLVNIFGNGNVRIGSTANTLPPTKLYVEGNATFEDDVEVAGNVNISDNLNVEGNITGSLYYGEIQGKDIGITPVDSIGVYYNVTNVSTGHMNGFSMDTDGMIVEYDGIYKITSSVSFNGGSNTEYHFALGINSLRDDHCHSQRKIGTGNDVGTTMFTCIDELNAGDILTVMVENVDNTNDVNVQTLNLNAHRVGNS